MRTPILSVVAVAVLLVGCSPTSKGPLSFQSPADWKVEHETPGGLDSYTVTAKTPVEGLLMFSQWPAPSRPEDIPSLVRKLADGFHEQAKKSAEITLAGEEYRVEQFVGEHCQGSYATFQFTSGGTTMLHSMFMMSVDGRVWNGQFTGPSNAWIQAIGVLKSVKKKG